MSNIIEVTDVKKQFGDFSLKGISFSLEPGYIMGFVGPNGAGKSTTIKLMLNLLRKQGGSIKLFGLDNITHESEVKQQIGFVSGDDTSFPANMTVEKVGWFVSGFYRRWDDKLFRMYARKFELPVKMKVKALSTGMKTKLALAVALSHHAKLLILDEPTSGLDPVVRDDILNELFETVSDSERGVFFSTHITSDLDKVADYITFIRRGEIVLSTTRDEINDRYAMVKGAKDVLPQVMRDLIRYRQTQFGFEALACNAENLRGRGGIVLEKARIEDILLMYEKGETPC